jgi:hypothetical protein
MWELDMRIKAGSCSIFQQGWCFTNDQKGTAHLKILLHYCGKQRAYSWVDAPVVIYLAYKDKTFYWMKHEMGSTNKLTNSDMWELIYSSFWISGLQVGQYMSVSYICSWEISSLTTVPIAIYICRKPSIILFLCSEMTN